jgi:hypothetical protein
MRTKKAAASRKSGSETITMAETNGAVSIPTLPRSYTDDYAG